MKSVDIMAVLVSAVKKTIFGDLRHDGFIGGWTTDAANFDIDGKEYALELKEVTDGKNWRKVLIDEHDNQRS